MSLTAYVRRLIFSPDLSLYSLVFLNSNPSLVSAAEYSVSLKDPGVGVACSSGRDLFVVAH